MIFSYWVGNDNYPEKFCEFWSKSFAKFQIFSDDIVSSIIKHRYPALYIPYQSIRIPSCKSDIARLILLETFGGLYIDAHTGCQNFANLANWLSASVNFELGLLDKIDNHIPPSYIFLVNGAMYAKKNTLPINILIQKVQKNLITYYELERGKRSNIKYNISSLTGAWNLRSEFCYEDADSKVCRLRTKFLDTVSISPLTIDQNACLNFYTFYQYRSPGQHWSERQQNELLFTT